MSKAAAPPAAGLDSNRAYPLLYAVGRLDHVLRGELRQRLEPLGLTLAELTALSVLGTGDGLSNAELARRSLVTPQAMSQLLGSLEEKRLVDRAPSSDSSGPAAHPRARAARLTGRGQRIMRRGIAIADDVEETCFAQFGAADRTTVATALIAATQNLRGAEDAEPGADARAS